ncbi:hypothetical protein KIPB_016600, partial [Kipferlia bialata]
GDITLSGSGDSPSVVVASGTELKADGALFNSISSFESGTLNVDGVDALSLGAYSGAVRIGSSSKTVTVSGTVELGLLGGGITAGHGGAQTILHSSSMAINTALTDGAVVIGHSATPVSIPGDVSLGSDADSCTVQVSGALSVAGAVTLGQAGETVAIGGAGIVSVDGDVRLCSSAGGVLGLGVSDTEVSVHGASIGVGTAAD